MIQTRIFPILNISMNRNKNNLFLPYTVIILGITSITAQVLLMRELSVIFYGNELSLGVMLGVWLFWTAVGSSIFPMLWGKRTNPIPISHIQVILVPLLPIMLWLVRFGKSILSLTLGEMIGFTPMLLITLLTMAPFCIINGCLYTTACSHMKSYHHNGAAAIGRVYWLEAIGAGIGGLLAGLFLVSVSSTYTLFALSLLNLFSVLFLAGDVRSSRKISYGLRSFILLSATIIILCTGKSFQYAADKLLWKGFNLSVTKNTIHGNISLTRTRDLTNLYHNGILTTTTPDPLTAEESVHFALLQHPDPKSVLIIGGSLNGGIGEILRHPSIERIDAVELDPIVYSLAEQYFPKEIMSEVKNPRVKIHHTDGRRFLKTTMQRFDAILINLPDPYNAQLNRFYTYEFFREVHEKLNDVGVFSFSVSSSENAVGPELADFLNVIDSTVKAAFTDRIIIPGETARFIASNVTGILTSSPDDLVHRLRDRLIDTQYVREYYIPYQMSRERLEYLQSRLRDVQSNNLNRDFKPVAYYYDTLLWATTYSRPFQSLFSAASRIKPIHLVGIVLVVYILLSLFIRRHKISDGGILVSILSIGFTEISLEVILLLSFQILYGYMYAMLSVIIAGYMMGLTLGSLNALKMLKRATGPSSSFRRYQGLMVLYPLFIAGFLALIHRLNLSGQTHQLTIWVFPLLSAGAGYIGGMQFPTANHLVLRPGRNLMHVAGFLYGFDLLGSAAGAILTSAFLIPLFGVYPVLAFLGFANLGCWFLLHIKKAG